MADNGTITTILWAAAGWWGKIAGTQWFQRTSGWIEVPDDDGRKHLKERGQRRAGWCVLVGCSGRIHVVGWRRCALNSRGGGASSSKKTQKTQQQQQQHGLYGNFGHPLLAMAPPPSLPPPIRLLLAAKELKLLPTRWHWRHHHQFVQFPENVFWSFPLVIHQLTDLLKLIVGRHWSLITIDGIRQHFFFVSTLKFE